MTPDRNTAGPDFIQEKDHDTTPIYPANAPDTETRPEDRDHNGCCSRDMQTVNLSGRSGNP